MNEDLSVFRDPETGNPLRCTDEGLVGRDGRPYPLVDGIPRFVDSANYSADFGLQWKAFPQTQLDSHSGSPISEERLARCMRGHLDGIAGKRVLEAGSGAGRFTEILLRHGAIVHSFDYSVAVEANASNNGASDRLTLAQADIRAIPFEKRAYDFVICLGVLQHTPDPEESIRSLMSMVKPNGHLVLDHYRLTIRHIVPPPVGGAGIVYRQFMRLVKRSRRLDTVKRIVDFWFPIHWRFRDSRMAQRVLRRLSPVHFYYPHLKLRDERAYYDWALLDTHDAVTDFYKHHRSVKQIARFLASLGGRDIVATKGGNGVEAMCRVP